MLLITGKVCSTESEDSGEWDTDMHRKVQREGRTEESRKGLLYRWQAQSAKANTSKWRAQMTDLMTMNTQWKNIQTDDQPHRKLSTPRWKCINFYNRNKAKFKWSMWLKWSNSFSVLNYMLEAKQESLGYESLWLATGDREYFRYMI